MTRPSTALPAAPRVSKWWALVVLALGLAMIVMDGTIVAVALPTIIDDLHLNLTDAQWVNSLYSIVFAALLLTTGNLGDRLGRRNIFIVGIVLFLAGSVWASQSGSAEMLIAARALQGVGGACILPSTLSTVNATFRGKDRAAAFGVWGAVMAGAAALGPLLGGWLTSSFSWQWIFYVNIPIGLVLIVAAVVAVPETRSGDTRPGFDMDGLLLSAIGFGALVFAIIEGATLGWWQPLTDLRVFGMTWSTDMPISIVPVLLLVAAIALTLFLFWERHRAQVNRSALLDLHMFFTPTFSWGNFAAMMTAVGEFGLIFVLPLFLINALGLSTLGAGFVLATMAAGAFISGSLARHLAALIGSAGTVVLGIALEIAGVLALYFIVSADASPIAVGGILVVYGVGLGLASAQLTSTVLADLPVELSGQGSATQSTVRQIGSALGSAVVGAALSVGLAHYLGGLSGPAERYAGPTRESAGGAIEGLRAAHGPDEVIRSLSESFASATQWALLTAAAFLALGLIASLEVLRVSRQARRAQPRPDDLGSAVVGADA